MTRRRRRRAATGPREELYPTLDLHGLTADEARRVAASWLRRQAAAGERLVRMVTGRGLRSRGPPVLKGEMEVLLGEMTDLVASWESDSLGGALRVKLHPHRPLPRRSRGPTIPADVDAALQRAAEEELSELGITPTPELLAAEIRRLSRGS